MTSVKKKYCDESTGKRNGKNDNDEDVNRKNRHKMRVLKGKVGMRNEWSRKMTRESSNHTVLGTKIRSESD